MEQTVTLILELPFEQATDVLQMVKQENNNQKGQESGRQAPGPVAMETEEESDAAAKRLKRSVRNIVGNVLYSLRSFDEEHQVSVERIVDLGCELSESQGCSEQDYISNLKSVLDEMHDKKIIVHGLKGFHFTPEGKEICENHKKKSEMRRRRAAARSSLQPKTRPEGPKRGVKRAVKDEDSKKRVVKNRLFICAVYQLKSRNPSRMGFKEGEVRREMARIEKKFENVRFVESDTSLTENIDQCYLRAACGEFGLTKSGEAQARDIIRECRKMCGSQEPPKKRCKRE